MRVTITGAAGFLGRKLTNRILERGTLAGPSGAEETVSELVLFDVVEAPRPAAGAVDVRILEGDIIDPATVDALFAAPPDSLFHLAAVMSGQAEEDFDLGMRVNLDGTRGLLEACRHRAQAPRFLMPASVAVMGGDSMPETIRDETAPTPTNSYGTQKAICELLVNDYSRKGFIDGRVVRLPTVVVRPGRPNRAASSFASGMIREPMQGEPGVVPVPKDTPIWIMSPRQAIETLLYAHDLPAEKLGHNRIITPVGLTVTVGEMAEALRRVGGEEPYRRLEWGHDPEIARIICGWAGRFESERARRLGFKGDDSMDAIIRAFIEDDMIKPGERSPA
jgi:D-erythronate 2-dehydrogenase